MSEMLQRKDIPAELKWDPSHIYATQEDWESGKPGRKPPCC